ncbi:MAG: glycosyltransferase, partial [Candidatus Omnitrophota bacterium]
SDGGSTDDTLSIVRSLSESMNIKLVDNKLKTGEAGKAQGLKQANNDILVFIDSDNILPQQDWLQKMAGPFCDPQILASEPLYYTYRKEDGYITRYCALIGMNDPLCLFLGNYDRYCLLTKKWTEMAVSETQEDSYIRVNFLNENLPTIGANGFFIRRKELLGYPIKDYLFDIDIVQSLYLNNRRLNIAKVKVGIIHIFSRTIGDFIAKQSRRFKDYAYYKARGLRTYRWHKVHNLRIFKFILYTLLFFPVFIQALRGYFIKKDRAWFFHPVACWVTLYIYAVLSVKNAFWSLRPQKR